MVIFEVTKKNIRTITEVIGMKLFNEDVQCGYENDSG